MLSIWIGRAGAGKSRRVLETMARQRSQRPQVLLVPEHISHEAEVDLCRALGPTASRDAEVLSFQSLGSRVLARTGGLAEFTLDGGGKLLTMRLALQELHSRLKVFGRPSQRAAFLRQLTDLTEEFYAYEITPQTLWQQVEDMEGAMGDKLRDLALLYAAYDGKLHAEGVDARSRLQKLRDRLAESDYLRGKDVYLDGFSYLNKLEESVLEQVMRQAESVTVTLLGDRAEGTLFQNALRQRQRLERMARQLGTECEIVWLTGSGKGPLAHLEKHLLGEDMPYEGDDCRQQVALWECGTVYGEVERTAAQIRKLVASGACRWRDIAVTARSMEVYGPVIESVFQRDGIPAYISRRSDILAKPPLTMLLGAVDAVTGGFRREDMFRYLKTGMAGITAEECDLLENYVILWSIRGNMWLRDTEWTANPDGYGQEMTPERQQRLAEVNRIRQKVRSTLLPLSDGLKDRPKARDKAEMLYIFAEESGVPLFQNALRQRQRLERMARQLGTECEIVWLTGSGKGPLAHLEKHLLGEDMPYEGDDCRQQVALWECGTVYGEVERTAAQIRKLVASGACRWRDIAVTARSMEVYGPVIESVFQRDGIPAYISRRSDILAKPPLTMLLGAVDAVTGGFRREDMFRYLKTGMAGITAEECDLLENYVILWSIRGNMWLRDTEWTANPDGYGQEMTPERQQRLAEVNRIRQKVRSTLLPLSDGLKDRPKARDKAEMLYIFAEESGVPQRLKETAEELLRQGQAQLAEEYSQLWRILCGVLDQMAEILGEMELSGEEFARLLRLVLTQYSVGTIPATLDQVKVSELTRNDRHSVKRLFLLGANDHVLPQPPSGHGLLEPEEREVLQQRDILLSDAAFDPLDNELQNIYACLAQPSEHLTVSYPVTDHNGGQLRPSFVVRRLERLFPGLMPERETVRLLTPAVALEEAGQEMGGSLWRYFAGREEYAGTLAAMERARQLRRGRLSPAAVQSLYGTRMGMSASRMDRVRQCHFGYFMQYGLRAKERRPAGFEAPEIGTFLHYLLENTAREVAGSGGWAAVKTPQLHAMVRKYIDLYIRDEIPGYEEKSARFRYLFGRLRTTAEDIVDRMAEELAESDFKPVAFELGFGGRDGTLPAITIQEGDATLSVSGKVDRVDGWLHDGKLYLRVVDYKTGRKSFDLSDVRYGLGIQMLLYLFTLEKEGQSCFGYPIVPAGVLYHPARDLILKADRDITPEALRRAMDRELRRDGMVLGDPEVLRAMEHSALEAPCFLPIQVSKDGGISGGVATAAQLGRLGQYVEKLLHQIIRELRQGNIDADPCWRGPQESACTYCDFASACHFQDGQAGDRLRPLKRVKADEFWEFVAHETGEEGRHGEF